MAAPVRWEYQLLACYNLESPERLALADRLGRAGWELVAVDRGDNWIFKRAIAAEERSPVVAVMTPAVERNNHAASARRRIR